MVYFKEIFLYENDWSFNFSLRTSLLVMTTIFVKFRNGLEFASLFVSSKLYILYAYFRNIDMPDVTACYKRFYYLIAFSGIFTCNSCCMHICLKCYIFIRLHLIMCQVTFNMLSQTAKHISIVIIRMRQIVCLVWFMSNAIL